MKKNIQINQSVFKAYDIRGVYPKELTEKTAELVGRAFVDFLKKKKRNKTAKLDIVVGRDNRASSPKLFKALKKAIVSEGANVIDIGLSPTPMFYFAVWKFGYDGGIQITASHNPPQYNGFKIVQSKAKIVGENTGLREIKKMVIEKADSLPQKKAAKKGRVVKKNVLKEYIEFNLKGFKKESFKDIKIVADTGNAVSGIWIRALKKYSQIPIFHLFPALNSRFPNHGLNPLEKENLKALQKKVKEKKASLGIIFDGDGDRIVFVDEKSRIVPSDFITALMAQIILRKQKGGKVLYNVCSSNIIKDVVKENGGIPIVTKIGHTFVKEEMEKQKAVFAGEFSGHFYSKRHHFCEAPLFVLCTLLQEISISNKPFSEIIKPFKRYFHSDQLNLRVRDKEKALKTLEKKYCRGKVSRLDGLRVDFKDWWFNIRPSNTEDLLRLVVEAKKEEIMKKRLKEIKDIIKDF